MFIPMPISDDCCALLQIFSRLMMSVKCTYKACLMVTLGHGQQTENNCLPYDI